MREETELLSNTLKEVAKAILKDTEDTGKFVEGRNKGMSTQVLTLNSNSIYIICCLHQQVYTMRPPSSVLAFR